MRIWKGLFYCFWMSDKPLVQEELAENISSMVASFQSTEGSLIFLTCFCRTFQREWNGVDRWRMDKTMMFVRRFLRQTFKMVKSQDWDEDLVASMAGVLREHVVLSTPDKSSLGFQLHLTDVILEELAKVGGSTLAPGVVEVVVGPWVELVAGSNDTRLREHAEERIFNHLLRQSDPGIDYQMEEDGMGEEDEEGEEEEGGDDDEEMEVDGEEEETAENGADPEDPRAGRVNVMIPQISVEYGKIGEELFQLGSKEGVRKSNRDALYRISKKFKDVAENIFPLGPNLEELTSVDIPKISIKKAAADMRKRNEDIRKKNLESKKNAKLLEKQKKKVARAEAMSNGAAETEDAGEGDDTNDEEEEDDDDDEEHDQKSESEEEQEPAEKKPIRENQKKKKQERKKLKRVAALKLKLKKEENERKIQSSLDHDMATNSALAVKKIVKTDVITNGQKEEKAAGSKKKRKKEKDATLANGHSSPAKKAKLDSVTESPVQAANGDELSSKKLKKKKKDKVKVEEIASNLKTVTETPPPLATEVLTQNGSSKKKKKKKEKEQVEITTITSVLNSKDELSGSSEKKKKKDKKKSKGEPSPDKIMNTADTKGVAKTDESTDKEEASKSKKLKKKKALHRIDSDISFSAPSLSKTHLPLAAAGMKAFKAPPAMAPISEASTPEVTVNEKKKKKMKKYNAETSLLSPPKSANGHKAEKLDFGPPSGKVA